MSKVPHCTGCGEYPGEFVADRIEELQAQRNFAQRQVVAAEAKLAKAVSVLKFLDENYRLLWGVTARAKMRATLAELKGETDE